MEEFEYPMWFKSLTNDQVVEFDSIDTGIVIKKGFLDECSNIGYYDMWVAHTDTKTWLNVTDQYKDKATIPPLEMCGMPKCIHDMPYDSECEECQKEAQEKQNKPFNLDTLEKLAESSDFRDSVINVLDNIEEMLIEKNKSYGNAALNPLRIFSKASPIEQLKVRIDDKLSRIAKGNEFIGDDTINDLIGYLVLYKIATKENNVEK